MYDVGEHVVHPGQGVCTVVGHEDGPEPMIVLEARAGRGQTRLMYPASQADRLHPCIGRAEAEALIAGYGELEEDPHTERNGSLEEAYFKQRLKLGAPETVRIVKTMHARIAAAERRGKRPSSYCARILKEARRRAAEELSVALDCTEEELEARIAADA